MNKPSYLPLLFSFITFLFSLSIAQAQERVINITSEATYSTNEGHCFYLVKIKFNVIQNLYGAPSPSREIEVIQGRTKLFSLRKQNANQSTNFNYTFQYRKGKAVKKLKKDLVYLLPIKSGKMTKTGKLVYIGETYTKEKEEEKPKDYYSISFTTEVGDTIYASRGGVTIAVKENYAESGTALTFKKEVNQVEIFHKDGTFASYRLFQKNGIFVQPGEKVEAGQAIGIIGGERFDSGSHVRMMVFYAHPEGSYAYIKPHFLTEEREGILDPNQIHTALHKEEIIIQEMNKRQLKKWKKKKDL